MLNAESIIQYMNSNRKSTIWLLALASTSEKISQCQISEMSCDFMKIEVIVKGGKPKFFLHIPFKEPLSDNNDARKKLVDLHEKRTFIFFPNVLTTLFCVLLWIFPLILSTSLLSKSVPEDILPYVPKRDLALMLLYSLAVIHLMEALFVIHKLLPLKVSYGTLISWFVLTIWFGYPVTEKAILLNKIHRGASSTNKVST